MQKLVKRLDQLELQLIKEEKKNAMLLQKVEDKDTKIDLYKAEIRYLRKQLNVVQMQQSVQQSEDDDLIQKQAIFNAEVRALKNELQQKQSIIETQQEQIEQLQRYSELLK